MAGRQVLTHAVKGWQKGGNNMIKISRQGAVLRLQMHRPEKKNALSLAMYQQLTDALKQASDDPTVHVVVLCGVAGSFSAGNDLQDFLSAGTLNYDHPTVQFLHQLSVFAKPLIAEVDGLAIGIGTTALLHCDLVYATASSRFAMPFTALGLCPEAASSLLLPQLVGFQRAAQYLLLGEAFDAGQAMQMGLLNAVSADSAALTSLVAEKAAQLAALPVNAVLTSKRLMRQSQKDLVQQVLHRELADFETLLRSDDCHAALTKFLTKTARS